VAQFTEAARSLAELESRRYVVPMDIKTVALGRLRSELLWNDDVPSGQVDDLIRALIDNVEVP
jgi:MoxR-like ATPase